MLVIERTACSGRYQYFEHKYNISVCNESSSGQTFLVLTVNDHKNKTLWGFFSKLYRKHRNSWCQTVHGCNTFLSKFNHYKDVKREKKKEKNVIKEKNTEKEDKSFGEKWTERKGSGFWRLLRASSVLIGELIHGAIARTWKKSVPCDCSTVYAGDGDTSYLLHKHQWLSRRGLNMTGADCVYHVTEEKNQYFMYNFVSFITALLWYIFASLFWLICSYAYHVSTCYE